MITKLIEYLKAGYSHFYFKTEEQSLAVEYIQQQLKEWKENLNINIWGYNMENNDPLEPLLFNVSETEFPRAIILKNYDWYLFEDPITKKANKDIVQYIMDTMELFRTDEQRTIVCIVSTTSIKEGLPNELVRDFVEVHHPLPTRKEIEAIVNETIEVAKDIKKEFPIPDKKTKNLIIDSAIGMKRSEIQNSCFLSVVKSGELRIDEVIDRRTAYLESIAGIKYIQYEERFNNLKGYDIAKDFVSLTLPNPKSKGICLLGPSGTGKSHFAKATSGEFGIPQLTIEMAELQGGIVGQTEENVRKIIEVAKSFIQTDSKGKSTGRLIMFIDEIEKGFSGTGGKGSYTSDSMNERANAQLLKFMQDRPDGIYFIATCNDVYRLPPEYLRAERWDTAPFFIDLPQEDERQEILNYYVKYYNVDKKELKDITPQHTDGWTGSEIKTSCRLSNILKESGKNVSLKDIMETFIVPISTTKKEEIEALRKWSEGRTLQASRIKIDKSKGYSTKLKRQIEL